MFHENLGNDPWSEVTAGMDSKPSMEARRISPRIVLHFLVMSLKGYPYLDPSFTSWDGFKPAYGVRNVSLGGYPFNSVSNCTSVVPRPVCTNQAVEGFMFAYSPKEGVSSCLIVATLNVERS